MLIKESQINHDLLVKQVAPLFKSTLFTGIANILAAILVFLLLEDTPLRNDAFLITIAVITVSVARIILSKIYLRKENNTFVYLQSHVFLTFITGILWGIFAYIQIYTNDETLRNLVFLINFGLIAASLATLSTWLMAYLAYMLPQSFVIFYVFLTIESHYNLYMVLAYTIFTITMILTSLRFNKGHKNEIQLTLYNKELIEDLNNEVGIREKVQLELEKNQLNLEIKVKERTKKLQESNLDLSKVISKKEKAEESLQYLAYHDELTGLPNKTLLVDRISQSINTSARENQKMAILFLDLDRFKTINDSLGHTIGDKLLREVSSRLYTTLRSRDTISRNSGDEFVVVLERLKNSNEAIHVAKKLIRCISETFEIDSHKIHIGASVGISIYPGDGESPLVLLRNADTAMYRAKQSGGKQLQFYDKSMSNQLQDRLKLENELHNALSNNEFYVVYQPQVNCATGITTGFESLLRWNNKKFGEISPEKFVPLLEETGLIYSVGEWIVTQVIDFIQQHQINNIGFSINLSVLQCNDFNLINFVKHEIKRTGINPSQLEFEITESLLINDFEKTKEFLNELHSLGCTIALDDFGTGYTSMSYLARLPIDVIKLDKTLVRNVDINENLKSIVGAIVTMSKSLGMKNIFEGIETKDELAVIKNMGGNIIQGYLFSRPLVEKDVDGWLQSKQITI